MVRSARRQTWQFRRAVPALLAAALLSCSVVSCHSAPPGRPSGEVESKVALIQFAPALGQVERNLTALTALVEEALRNEADIVVAPELATTGFSITKEQVAGGWGLTLPDPRLEPLRELSARHEAWIVLGFAEILPGSGAPELHNSALILSPDGRMSLQRKRGLSGWHSAGNLPFDIVSTPFGDLATIICSDTYLMDWIRIASLAGADVIVAPANWWGSMGQAGIWRTRARENGVWMVVANRWGSEVDTRFDPPYTYDMNDSPSAVIAPDGEVKLLARPDQPGPPADTILYSTVRVPASRLGAANPTYTLAERRPTAYTALATPADRPLELPPPGAVRVAVLTAPPAADPAANLDRVAERLAREEPGLDVLLLPGLGISAEPVSTAAPDWSRREPWSRLQSLIDERKVGLAVTTVRARTGNGPAGPALLLLQAGKPPRIAGQIHRAGDAPGTGRPPEIVDLPHARVGVVTGTDSLFPEIGTQMAKSGADLVVVSSEVAAASPGAPAGWTMDDLARTWRTQTNSCFHLTAADASGAGYLLEDGGCFPKAEQRLGAEGSWHVRTLDTGTERKKVLNRYLAGDLERLLAGVD